MFAIVECADRDVVDGAIGGDDEVLDFIFVPFAFFFEGLDQAVVEDFSLLFNSVEVVGIFEGLLEGGDGGVEFGFTHGAGGAAEDAALGGPEEVDFVGEDEGIDQDGARLGVDDFGGAGDEVFVAIVNANEGAFKFGFFERGLEIGCVSFEISTKFFKLSFEGCAILAAITNFYAESNQV
ncbi:MAG: hypothetical protein VKJ24_16400, partial [Synechococcales bacterium]|nr:hypothetical protein [Synechococcales bacterium]